MVTERNTARIVGALILIAYVVVGSLILESVIISMLLEVITGVVVIGMAVLMLPILKPVNKNLALGYSTIKIIDGLLYFITGTLLLFSATGMYDSIHAITPYFFGIGFLILSYLFYRSKLVPRFISVWGIIGSILLLFGTLLSMITINPIPFFITHLPVIANEIILAVWLRGRGFSKNATL